MMKEKNLFFTGWKIPFSVIFALLVIFLLIKSLMPCHEYVYYYDNNSEFNTGEAIEDAVVYDGISLKPGVYRIELEYNSSEDLNAVCNVEDGTVFTRGLLTNGEHFYSALHSTGFLMWLYESTDNLQVTVTYNGEGTVSVGTLKIVETNGMMLMFLTIVIIAGIFVYGYMLYMAKRRHPMNTEQKHVLFCITVIALAASVPYLCGYNIAGADLTYHLRRIEGVKDGLLAGQFPVRLEPRWLYDHGYANAIFYCNALLYFPAFLRILGFPISAAYNAYCIAINFATAAIAYYCFSRMFGKKNIGIVCSAFYTLSIFHIYKLIITSACGEGSAVTFMPLVLYGLYRIFTEKPDNKKYRTAWIPLMIGIAGLIQTHVLSCEITALVVLLFCIVYIRKILSCRNTFMELLKGAVSSALVGLWFLVPFLDYYLTQDMHIKHVSARTIQDRGLYIAQLAFHFWRTGSTTSFAEDGMQNSHPVGLGFVLCAGLLMFMIFWFSGRFSSGAKRGKYADDVDNVYNEENDNSIYEDEKRTEFVKVTAVIGTLMLLMSLNIFPWDRIQSLSSITASLVSSLQFPNRFLGWGTCCLVCVFGYLMYYFDRNKQKTLYWCMALAALISVSTSSLYLIDYLNCEDGYYQLYNEEGMGFGYISGAEYLIEGTDENLLTFADAVCGEGVEITEYTVKSLGADIECTNFSDTDSYIDAPLLLYKGYGAEDADTGETLTISAGDNNVVRIQIPAGFSGHVKVRFTSPFYWRISEIISAVSVIFFIYLLIKQKRQKNYDKKAEVKAVKNGV